MEKQNLNKENQQISLLDYLNTFNKIGGTHQVPAGAKFIIRIPVIHAFESWKWPEDITPLINHYQDPGPLAREEPKSTPETYYMRHYYDEVLEFSISYPHHALQLLDNLLGQLISVSGGEIGGDDEIFDYIPGFQEFIHHLLFIYFNHRERIFGSSEIMHKALWARAEIFNSMIEAFDMVNEDIDAQAFAPFHEETDCKREVIWRGYNCPSITEITNL